MARIGKREDSERKVVKLTIELSEDERAQVAELSASGSMTLYVHDNGDLVLVFEERP